MLARVNMLFSFFYSPQNDPDNSVSFDELKSRLETLLNARYQGENAEQQFTENYLALCELMKQAKKHHYNLNTHNKHGYTFVNQVIIRNTPESEEYCIKILELLHEHGADLNMVSLDARRNAPLISACRRGMPKTVEWLLWHGANPLIKDQANGQENKSAREYIEDAIKYHQKNVAMSGEQSDISLRLNRINDLLCQHESLRIITLN